jgi:hypothetical protein
MNGKGQLHHHRKNDKHATVLVTDTGKGLPKKQV